MFGMKEMMTTTYIADVDTGRIPTRYTLTAARRDGEGLVRNLALRAGVEVRQEPGRGALIAAGKDAAVERAVDRLGGAGIELVGPGGGGEGAAREEDDDKEEEEGGRQAVEKHVLRETFRERRGLVAMRKERVCDEVCYLISIVSNLYMVELYDVRRWAWVTGPLEEDPS